MKFGIDLGHGVGKDRGAVGVIAEENIINTIGILVISKLPICVNIFHNYFINIFIILSFILLYGIYLSGKSIVNLFVILRVCENVSKLAFP